MLRWLTVLTLLGSADLGEKNLGRGFGSFASYLLGGLQLVEDVWRLDGRSRPVHAPGVLLDRVVHVEVVVLADAFDVADRCDVIIGRA